MPISKATPKSYKRNLATAKIQIETDSFKVALMDATFIFDRDVHNNWGDVFTNEIAHTGGYVGAYSLSAPVITNDISYVADFGNLIISAVGGSITFNSAIMFDDTAENKPIIASFRMGSLKVLPNGESFSLQNINIIIGD